MQKARGSVAPAFALMTIGLISCRGSDSPPAPVTVGGTVTGLSGSGLVLTDNGTDALSVSASGAFVFASKVKVGTTFSVEVESQPAQPTQTCVVVNGAGTAGATGVTDVGISCTTNPASLRLFAGNLGGGGTLDGTGSAAGFADPSGVVVDPAGDIYVVDLNGVRKVTAAGVVTTLLDTAVVSGNPNPSSVTFGQIAIDASGNLFVADITDETIRKITPAGAVTTLAGDGGVLESAAAELLRAPYGVAADVDGNVYVADTNNNLIQKITPSGVVTTLAGSGAYGALDGIGTAAQFNQPKGLAIDASGNIYVADTHNEDIRKVTPGGVVTTFAGVAGSAGSADGIGNAARFWAPQGITIDGAGNIYVADTANSTIRKITPAGVVTTVAGKAPLRGGADGTGSGARFFEPVGVALDASGDVYVADTGNSTLRKISASGAVTTLAGSAAVTGYLDGVGPVAQFESPQGLATDAQGNVYVADSAADTIRKITPGAIVTTLAGFPGSAGDQDGTGTAARLSYPTAIAADAAGDLYVSSSELIRKVTPSATVSTFATDNPAALTVDSAGNIDVADNNAGPFCSIRQYTPAGVATSLACGYGEPSFGQLTGIAIDASGTIYVADFGERVIQKIVPPGVVTTLAGQTGVQGVRDGIGTDAQFIGPYALTIDAKSDLYVIDGEVIRKVTPAGVVTTIAGVRDQLGFRPGPLPGILYSASGIAISGTSLYLSMAHGVAVIENVP